MKILGLIFNEKLSFEAHVNNALKSAKSNLYLLVTMRNHGFRRTDLRLLYELLLLSKLTYGCLVWGGVNNSLKTRMENIQRSALKLGISDSCVLIGEPIQRSDEQLFCKTQRCGGRHLSALWLHLYAN